MSIKIRLKRCGSKKRPFYHVVAADSRAPRNGRFKEKLGYYNPLTEPAVIELKSDRCQHWFERGAQLTPTVERLVKIKKIDLKRKPEAAQ